LIGAKLEERLLLDGVLLVTSLTNPGSGSRVEMLSLEGDGQ
jgi:hypothetical protein